MELSFSTVIDPIRVDYVIYRHLISDRHIHNNPDKIPENPLLIFRRLSREEVHNSIAQGLFECRKQRELTSYYELGWLEWRWTTERKERKNWKSHTDVPREEIDSLREKARQRQEELCRRYLSNQNHITWFDFDRAENCYNDELCKKYREEISLKAQLCWFTWREAIRALISPLGFTIGWPIVSDP